VDADALDEGLVVGFGVDDTLALVVGVAFGVGVAGAVVEATGSRLAITGGAPKSRPTSVETGDGSVTSELTAGTSD
jgi:hypothetical protein